MGTSPKRYRARFIEPGVISYEDIGMGLVMVGRNALDRMRPSFVGMPVFNFVHKDVEAPEAFDFENATKENMAVGIISSVGTGEDGWDWADMMIWDEETQVNIEKNGFTVSCAYDTIQSGPPGKHNGIEFDEEVLDGKYVHMAIVDNPRYEGSTVIRNSKGGQTVAEKKKGWLFTKKNAEPVTPPPVPEEKEKENALEDPMGPQVGNGAFMVVDGQKVPIEELIECVQGTENADEGNAVGLEDTVEVDGKTYTGAELLAAYKAKHGAPMENAKVIDANDAGKTMANSTTKALAATEKEEPNEHFRVIKKNAQAAAPIEVPRPIIKSDRIKTGQERYGSAVGSGGK